MERARDIEDLVVRWFEAASSGDRSLVDAHVSSSPNARLIGSDPDEWFAGGEQVAAFLAGEVEGAGGQVRFAPERIEAFAEGSVGWATAHVTITKPDGSFVSPRWSAVFHREGGDWRFVQTHASIGVPNDEIGWTYA
jgi:ketosteroid isomerase-like protein